MDDRIKQPVTTVDATSLDPSSTDIERTALACHCAIGRLACHANRANPHRQTGRRNHKALITLDASGKHRPGYNKTLTGDDKTAINRHSKKTAINSGRAAPFGVDSGQHINQLGHA
jgi:hypothetical protein